jgi:hypothetical protein
MEASRRGFLGALIVAPLSLLPFNRALGERQRGWRYGSDDRQPTEAMGVTWYDVTWVWCPALERWRIKEGVCDRLNLVEWTKASTVVWQRVLHGICEYRYKVEFEAPSVKSNASEGFSPYERCNRMRQVIEDLGCSDKRVVWSPKDGGYALSSIDGRPWV